MHLPDVEAAIAAEAAAHAEAAAALNPYCEAEAVALGRAQLVYSGAVSPVHGVYGLGLDGPPEEADWREIRKFFSAKDRPAAFWITPFTDRAVAEEIKATHRPTRSVAVRGLALPQPAGKPVREAFLSGPDHNAWAKAFGESLAFVKLHQRHTRFFLEGDAASYTFFHLGIALIPHPAAAVLPRQERETFHSNAIVVMGEAGLPLLYERVLHEQI